MEAPMDRTALAAALAAGLLAPAGGMADDQEPVDRGMICGDPAPGQAVKTSPAEKGAADSA